MPESLSSPVGHAMFDRAAPASGDMSDHGLYVDPSVQRLLELSATVTEEDVYSSDDTAEKERPFVVAAEGEEGPHLAELDIKIIAAVRDIYRAMICRHLSYIFNADNLVRRQNKPEFFRVTDKDPGESVRRRKQIRDAVDASKMRLMNRLEIRRQSGERLTEYAQFESLLADDISRRLTPFSSHINGSIRIHHNLVVSCLSNVLEQISQGETVDDALEGLSEELMSIHEHLRINQNSDSAA